MIPLMIIPLMSLIISSGNTMIEENETMMFPQVSGKDLTGQKFTAPDDFVHQYSLVIVAFLREQQADVDTWIPPLETLENKRQDFHFYEFPTIKNMNFLAEWFIYQGMRSGIPQESARKRTVTLHIDKGPFKEQLDISQENNIYLFLVNQKGHILWRNSGTWTEEKYKSLMDFLAIDGPLD